MNKDSFLTIRFDEDRFQAERFKEKILKKKDIKEKRKRKNEIKQKKSNRSIILLYIIFFLLFSIIPCKMFATMVTSINTATMGTGSLMIFHNDSPYLRSEETGVSM